MPNFSKESETHKPLLNSTSSQPHQRYGTVAPSAYAQLSNSNAGTLFQQRAVSTSYNQTDDSHIINIHSNRNTPEIRKAKREGSINYYLLEAPSFFLTYVGAGNLIAVSCFIFLDLITELLGKFIIKRTSIMEPETFDFITHCIQAAILVVITAAIFLIYCSRFRSLAKMQKLPEIHDRAELNAYIDNPSPEDKFTYKEKEECYLKSSQRIFSDVEKGLARIHQCIEIIQAYSNKKELDQYDVIYVKNSYLAMYQIYYKYENPIRRLYNYLTVKSADGNKEKFINHAHEKKHQQLMDKAFSLSPLTGTLSSMKAKIDECANELKTKLTAIDFKDEDAQIDAYKINKSQSTLQKVKNNTFLGKQPNQENTFAKPDPKSNEIVIGKISLYAYGSEEHREAAENFQDATPHLRLGA